MPLKVDAAQADAVAGAALLRVQARRRAANPLAAYWADPVAFVHDCFLWRDDEGPTSYQDEILAALPERRRVAARGPHGLGKSALSSWAVLWFALTRDAAGVDWKTITTAGGWTQLAAYLWPEIRKWATRLRWDQVGRAPFDPRTELLALNLKLRHGAAFAVASKNFGLLEGAHATQLLYLFDESKLVPAATFDAAEGAFSGAGGDTRAEAYALACSTPGEPNGRFYEIHARRPGYEDWLARHVRLDEAMAAGRISAEWVEARAHQWGEDSALFQNRVLGEFAASAEDAVIPLAWVEAAQDRWRDWEASGGALDEFTCVGCDVGRGGDKTVLALRYGPLIAELRRSGQADTMDVAGRVAALLEAHGGYAVVDVIGIGAGVVDRLREQHYDVTPFNAAAGSDEQDPSGEWGFSNARAAAWWNLRALLDPSTGSTVALPPDDLLTGDLTAPRWQAVSGGKLKIESKADIRQRLGRSTDDADAVVQAFWRREAVLPSFALPDMRKASSWGTPQASTPVSGWRLW